MDSLKTKDQNQYLRTRVHPQCNLSEVPEGNLSDYMQLHLQLQKALYYYYTTLYIEY